MNSSMQFSLSIFTGNKFCLFNYATITTGGFVDFDWFRTGMPTRTEVAPEEGLPSNDMPHNFFLGQNYPNPFNPTTAIQFSIPKSSFVTLQLADVLGKEIRVLISEQLQAGKYRINWNAEDLPSGVYFYRLKVGNFMNTKKTVLLK